MQNVRVALVQLPWLGSRAAMMEEYRHLVGRAAREGASLVCLPEFSLSPYFPSTTDVAGFHWAEALHGGETDIFFCKLAEECGVSIVSSLYEKAADDQYFDTALIHDPDKGLVGSTRKIHIPSGEGYNETNFFKGGVDYPVFDLGSVTIAAPTCYDQWFPELARIYTLNGAEFIFYPTAIGSEPTDSTVDSKEAWQTVMRGNAIANGIYIGAANRVGKEGPVQFYGSSFICDPTGKILAEAGRDTTEVITAELDAHTLEHWRKLFPLMRQRAPHSYGRITEPKE
jgi:N-carbamoylputrescine amidase